MDDERLDPCPFCGGDDIVIQGTTSVKQDAWVECNGCQTTGPVAAGLARAASDWNDREADR